MRNPCMSKSARSENSSELSTLDHTVLLTGLVQRLEPAIQMLAGMSRHVARAQHRALRRYARRDERVRVDAVLLEQLAPHHQRAQILPDVDRDHGGLGMAELEP